MVQFQLEGADEILDALAALGPKNLFNIIKASERKALTENIVKPVRAAVPYSANVKKNIKVVQDRKDGGGLAFFAGVDSDVFWIRFVEKGTKERPGRGRITPKPSAIPAIEENIQGVVDFFGKDFGEEINNILEKRIKKAKK